METAGKEYDENKPCPLLALKWRYNCPILAVFAILKPAISLS